MNTENLETLEQAQVAEATPVNGRGLAFVIVGVITAAVGIGVAIFTGVKAKKVKKTEVVEPETVEEVATA